jgi:hypothetical protein
MNVVNSGSRPMCLYGEGVGCKAVVGHGSGGRPRHGLHVKSTLESDQNFKQNLLESSEVPGGSKNELKTYSIVQQGGGGISLTKMNVPRYKWGISRWRSVTCFPVL